MITNIILLASMAVLLTIGSIPVMVYHQYKRRDKPLVSSFNIIMTIIVTALLMTGLDLLPYHGNFDLPYKGL
ncbi:hypothetical protein L4C54_23420 [Vibrio lamellibrachiae]|uniref:hypothetical protein n=1 Tax=Vibrio lamellibrachiae TaxID=2910253 RepID=UPI003D0E4097